jgi:hypothetical protein
MIQVGPEKNNLKIIVKKFAGLKYCYIFALLNN